MWLIHCAVRYKLEGNQESYDRAYFAAWSLAARFNPKGFIRAWNGKDQQGWAIIDCMMNLQLLYWASDMTNDPRFKLIAMQHADTAMKHFVRDDGSVKHIVVFDPETGEEIDNLGGQGYEKGSSWSRGQSWALYGFTLSYLCTGKKEYLDTAKKVAHYFISNVLDDYIPRCDFRQPEEPDVKDNAGGGAAICGLLELCKLLPQKEAAVYYDAAVKMLKAMAEKCVNWEENDPGLCTMCTEAYHKPHTYHITMDYADYYFVEALTKLRGQRILAWQPHK
jgi:unsaturated chondroitin disaccharide hydrolase